MTAACNSQQGSSGGHRAGRKGLQATMQGEFAPGLGSAESAATSAPGSCSPACPPPQARAIPTLCAVLVVLHVRRRRVRRRRRGAGRRSRARAGAAAAAQFRQSPVGGREFGSQVGHLLAGRLDRPIDAERELLIVFHHAQDFGLGAREVTKSCMMRRGRAAGRPRLYLLGTPRPGSPAPRPPGTGSAGSSGAGMTAAPPAGAAAVARRRGEEEEKEEEKEEEEEQRSPRPRCREPLGEGHRAPPGTLSMEPTIRRALWRGPGPGAGAHPPPPAPPTSGTHPLGGGGGGRRPGVGRGGAPGQGWGGACFKAGLRSPPWSGGAAPALAN